MSSESESDGALDDLWQQRAARLAKKRRVQAEFSMPEVAASSLAAPPTQGSTCPGPEATAPSQGQVPAPWLAWAACMRQLCQSHRQGLGRQKRSIRVAELCSGLCTATRALTAVGLFDVETVMTVDPSERAKKMSRASSHRSQHHFERIADILCPASTRGICAWHGGPCEISLSTVDLLVIGVSCKPYSRQRAGRTTEPKSVQAHPEFHLLEEFVEVMRRHQIPLAVFENVPGFLLEDEKSGETHLELLTADLEKAGYVCIGIMLDARTWLPVGRERLYLLIGRRDFYTVEDLRRASTMISNIEHGAPSVPSISECLFRPGDAGWMAMQKQWQRNRSRQRGPAPTQGEDVETVWQKSSKAHRNTLLKKGMLGWSLKPWTGVGAAAAASTQSVGGQITKPRVRGTGQTEAKKELLDCAFVFGCGKKNVDPVEAMRKQSARQRAAANLFCDVSQGICRHPWTLDVLNCTTTSSVWYSFERDSILDPREIFRLHGFDTPPEDVCNFVELQGLIGNCMAVPSVGSVLHGLLCSCGSSLPDCFER